MKSIPFTQSVGKTIARYLAHGRQLFIAFTDGTYAVAEADSWDDAPPKFEELDKAHEINQHGEDDEVMLFLGLITQEQINKRNLDFERRCDAERDARDRQEFERLKRKFES